MAGTGVSLSQAQSTRVIIADSSRMGNQLLSNALSRDHRFKVLGSVVSSHELLQKASQQCDVLLMAADFEKDDGGFEITKMLRDLQPEVKAVLLLDDLEQAAVVAAFRAGAKAVFGRSEPLEQLWKCIACVHAGQIWAGTRELQYLLEGLQNSMPVRLLNRDGLSLLSDREQDVIRYICDGLGNREIAQRMGLSQHTIKNHLSRIYTRLGVSSRVEVMFSVLGQRVIHVRQVQTQLQEKEPGSDTALFEKYLEHAEHSPLAQFMVGQMYLEGRGTEKDLVSGYMWLTLAEQTAQELLQSCSSIKNVVQHLIEPRERAAAESRAAERKTEPRWRSDVRPLMTVPLKGKGWAAQHLDQVKKRSLAASDH